MTEPTGLEAHQAALREASHLRLKAALEKLEKDGRIPATQAKLAELASLSRRALSLPGKTWALTALKAIQSARKEQRAAKAAAPEDGPLARALTRANEAEAALAAVRSHVAGLVEENDRLTRKVAALNREIAALGRKS